MTTPLFGVYTDPDRMAVIERMEQWLGTSHAIQTVFAPWSPGVIDELFDRILPSIWAAGRVPLLTWEPFTPTPDATPTDIAARIIAGEYDEYLDRWADRLAAWLAGPDGELGTTDDRRLYLRLAHEMNGDWYPWSPTVGENSSRTTDAPSTYRKMWRHVHDRIERGGIENTHCQWLWCVNHVDVGGVSMEDCYPGDAFVDWLGVDGFNWGDSREWSAWHSPAAVFDDAIDRLTQLADNPIAVPEFASTSLTANGHDPARKAAWIRAAYGYLDDAGVALACWFNEDKETDWAVFGGERGTERVAGEPSHEAYATYRAALVNDNRAEPPRSRIVSDAAFLGRG
ncbi:glycoside hydrolase family 26 protein [Halococcus saccharolyticus]|uniref:Endoglucanase family protein n=1 Tax=Halococcus saccharolyticus DSM 5350 TaxID=1227455 RepID=M0ME62_9EURY|nr:glycosyl hydrolase [Halococcus saccharolyticus]EMA44011.1 endoglucanase family protein [Halococcus saccharolyticus DSM 5350]